MFEKILLPLDGSAFAEFARPYAAEIARRAGAAVDVVMVHEPTSEPPPGERERTARTGQDQYPSSVVDDLRAYTGAPVSHSTPVGKPSDELASHIAETAPDLVVMSTHGRGPLSRVWLGSVADHLIRRSPRPILLVRPTEGSPVDPADISLDRVLIPLDGSELAEGVLDPALGLADLFHSSLTLIRIVPLPTLERWGTPTETVDREIREERQREASAYLRGVAGRLGGQDRSVEIDVEVDHVAAGIENGALEHTADVIALATRGQGGMRRALLGSVADKVIRGTAVPVLVHPSGAR